MSLEQHIKDLERKLALKKAYLGAEIKLPKGTAEDVRIEVEAALKDYAARLASSEENISQPVNTTTSQFTDNEVNILKSLVNAAMEKAGMKAPTVAKSNVPEAPKKDEPLTAVLLTTENIPAERRKEINSSETVLVKSYNDKEACIIFNNKRFVVPVDDLQFDNQ